MHISGTQINYLLVCKRKLWFFSHGVQCEQESELVQLGKIVHEQSYKNKRKEFDFGKIKIDWLDIANKVIHEVKKSDKAEKAHIWQVKYYLYYLEKLGIGEFTGEINYPLMKKKLAVHLTDRDRSKIEEFITQIDQINALDLPPSAMPKLSICKKCSYYEMCAV